MTEPAARKRSKRTQNPNTGEIRRNISERIGLRGFGLRGCGVVALALSLLSFFYCAPREDWIFYRGKNGSGYTPNTLRPPLGRRWLFRLQEKSKPAKTFNPPLVRGDTLYFGSSDKNFYAFDVNSGYRLWSFPTKAPINSIPFVDEKNAYFGSNDGKVYAVSREDGKKAWEFDTKKTVQSLVLRYQDMVIFTSDAGRTYFLDKEGKKLHSIPNPHWRHHSFQVHKDIMFWVPKGHDFAPYDVKKRRYLGWKETLPRDRLWHWYSFPALDDARIYYGSSGYLPRESDPMQAAQLPRLTFKARRIRDGQTLWKTEEKFEPGKNFVVSSKNVFLRYIHLLDYMAPALWRNLVIYSSGDTVLRAFDRESGKKVWRRKFPNVLSSAPTVAGNRIYLGIRGDEDGMGEKKPRLLCLSAKDGRVLWDMEVEGVILSAPVISGNRLMFGTSKYLFYVLEEIF